MTDAQQARLSVAAARERWLDSLSTRSPAATETVPLVAAHGRICAADLAAQEAVPPWPASAMDGYAVAADTLTAHEPVRLPVSARITAGTIPESLRPGTAARIFTGAPLPPGADTVVRQEDTRQDGAFIVIERWPSQRSNVRPAGEDLERGDLVVATGTRLGPAAVGLLATAGASAVSVQEPLRVAIVTTGDELVPAGAARRGGRIHDSNGPMLVALVAELGARSERTVQVEDQPDRIRDALLAAAAAADLVITTGGVSAGEEDHVRAVLEASGWLAPWRVHMKPGKPITFGRLGAIPVLGLPGHPVAAFVGFTLFAAPALRHYQGRTTVFPGPLRLPLATPLHDHDSRERWLRVQRSASGLIVHPLQKAAVLHPVVWADGLARVPADAQPAPGALLEYWPMTELLA